MSTGLLTRGRPVAAELDDMDPRLRARRIEVARDRGRRRFRRIIALAVLTALVLAGLAVSRSSLLDVDAVQVSGARQSGSDAVLDAAAIDLGRPMTSLDLGAAERRVEALPWVARASVERRWPGTVRIRVVERTAVAVAGTGRGAVLVDRDGRLLGPARAADELPAVGPVPAEDVGERLPAARRPVVRLLADLPPELRSEVARGTIGDDGLGLVLHDGIRVRLGDATRLRAKSTAVLALLEQADRPTIATIDVAVPGPAALTRSAPEGA